MKKSIIVIVVLLNTAFLLPVDDLLEQLKAGWAIWQEQLPAEEVHLVLAEPVLAAGDTLRFGTYLQQKAAASRVLYVELLNGQEAVSQGIYTVNKNTASGQLFLPDTLSSGSYRLRAYTQWMRNLGEHTFFDQPILVVNPNAQQTMTNREKAANQLSFYPEGKHWIAGLPQRLLIEYGDDQASLPGSVIRLSDTVRLADFRLEHGLAVVALQPHEDQRYLAELYLPSGDTLATVLPRPERAGVSLQAEFRGKVLHLQAYASHAEQRYLVVRSANQLMYSEVFADTALVQELPLDLGQETLLEITVLDEKANVLTQRLLLSPARPRTINIRLDKNIYAPRAPVKAQLMVAEDMDGAKVSVSVRKVHPVPAQSKDARWINDRLISQASPFPAWKNILTTPEAPKFAKEEEYLLLSGVVNKKGLPIRDQQVLLSVPGINPHFDYDETDSRGRYDLPVYNVYGEHEIVLQLAQDSLPADWTIYEKFAPILANDFKAGIELDGDQWKALSSEYRQREQIRRQYEAFRPNSDEVAKRTSRFYGAPNFEIVPDEYINLPSFVEVCRELMPGIQLRQEGGHYAFKVFDVRTRTFLEGAPGLVLDGVLIDDADAIAELQPSTIDRIETVNRRTYYGEYRFDGVIAVYTKEGEAYLNALPPAAEVQKVSFFTPYRPFVRPDSLAAHLPDFRTLLYWKPLLSLEGGKNMEITFGNADELGEFEIVVEGRTGEGQKIYGETTYTVSMSELQ